MTDNAGEDIEWTPMNSSGVRVQRLKGAILPRGSLLSLLTNNRERFCEWCLRSEARSCYAP